MFCFSTRSHYFITIITHYGYNDPLGNSLTINLPIYGGVHVGHYSLFRVPLLWYSLSKKILIYLGIKLACLYNIYSGNVCCNGILYAEPVYGAAHYQYAEI